MPGNVAINTITEGSNAFGYKYDGTFKGLLCCVFESYEKKEIPHFINSPFSDQLSLMEEKCIETDINHAERVYSSLRKKFNNNIVLFIEHAFFTFHPGKDLLILKFIRLAYRYGNDVINMLTADIVSELCKAVKNLEREAHLFKGFIRFTDYNGVLISEIEPKNNVLYLISDHFTNRFPNENFMIYDKTNHLAFVHSSAGGISGNNSSSESKYIPGCDSIRNSVTNSGTNSITNTVINSDTSSGTNSGINSNTNSSTNSGINSNTNSNTNAGAAANTGRSCIIPVDDFTLPEKSGNEESIQELWKHFYDTIGISERYNPRCRMSMMPKRYWKNMTEMNRYSS